MRLFDMTPQSLNLNIHFLNYWLFGHSEFCCDERKRPLLSNDTGKFSNFCLIVRPDTCDEIDDKKIICPSMRFFDMIPQSLKLSLFATYKLIKRPLASNETGKFPIVSLRVK